MFGWSEELSAEYLLSDDDGRVVFYPMGPLKGYVVPKPAYVPIVIKSLIRSLLCTPVIGFAIMFIGAAIGFGFNTVCALMFLAIVPYWILIRRLIRRMTVLPFGLAFRFYARHYRVHHLWQRLLGSLLMIGLFIFGLVRGFDPPIILISVMIWFGYYGIVSALLIRIRTRDSSVTRS